MNSPAEVDMAGTHGRYLPDAISAPSRAQTGAFTMLELLVAMAVFSLLIVMLMGMVDSATKLWRANENRVDAYREARAALTIISRDLRNAVTTNNTDYFLINNAAFAKLPESDVQKNTNSSGALFFLSSQPPYAQDTAANRSEVCEVGYFLGYGNTSISPVGTNTKVMGLYRYFRSSDGTFSNRTSNTPSLFTNVTMTGAETDLLARNIMSFRITPYHVDANGNCVAYNSGTYGAAPAFFEVSITALNQDTSRKLDSVGDWTNSSGPVTNVINQVQQTFTTRVRVANKL